MAPITRAVTFGSSRRPAEVFEAAKSWLASRASTSIAVTAPDRVEIKSGSQAKMRAIGGAFIAATSLPARTIVEARLGTGGTEVTVTAQDAVGLGLKTGMKRKYEGWLDEIVSGVQMAVG
jgi:hypothetical protein